MKKVLNKREKIKEEIKIRDKKSNWEEDSSIGIRNPLRYKNSLSLKTLHKSIF